jgi:hypothetical protein
LRKAGNRSSSVSAEASAGHPVDPVQGAAAPFPVLAALGAGGAPGTLARAASSCANSIQLALKLLAVSPRPRGLLLGRSGRGALAGAVGRTAPRLHNFGRMAPPLASTSLIPHLQGYDTVKLLQVSLLVCSLLGASLPFDSAFADSPKSKNAKVTLILPA